MKKNILAGSFSIGIIAALFALTGSTSSITGKVSPADAAETVWAISGTDSVRSAVSAGSFTLSVKAGTYKVVVDAKDPYKDILLENVVVKDDHPADVGEIVLQK